MTEPDGPELERALSDSLGDLFSGQKSMVTKWVSLIEIIEEDGERALWTFTSEGLKAWDTVGLLRHALDIQAAQTTADMIEGMK